MNDFVFLHPERWPFLLAPVVVALLAALVARRRRQALEVFAEIRAHPLLVSDAGPKGRGLRTSFELFGLVMLSVAALEPSYGFTLAEVERRGVDIVVCLDVSRSMKATDLAPSREARTHRDILALLPELAGDRIALVAFAGDAKIICPLTHDLAAFESLLRDVNNETPRRGGTNIGAALSTALAMLPAEQAKSQAILVLSDGEDLEGKGLDEAERARSRGIRVHTIGYGSVAGAKVPDRQAGTFLRDETGEEVISRMDSERMRELAETCGGEFLPAEGVALPLVELYEKRVLPMEQRRFEAQKRRLRVSRYQWCLLPGFFFLLLAFLHRGRVSPPAALAGGAA